jgi:hypothetical protein
VRSGAPTVLINGTVAQPARTSQGRGWRMESFDLLGLRGRKVEVTLGSPDEAWLVLDRPSAAANADRDPRLPPPVAHGQRRQTVRLIP